MALWSPLRSPSKIFDNTPDSASSYIVPTEISQLLNEDMELRIAE